MPDEQSRLTRVAAEAGGRSVESDPRVAAVLEVLAGRTAAEVARSFQVETALLRRWVRGFVDAGAAAVTNRPDERTARQRDRFLAAFAHEVRTPLSAALGWAKLLEEGDVAAEQADGTVTRLRRSLDRLHERTQDVELLASASLGRLAARPERIRLRELVDGLPWLEGVGGLGPDTTLLVDPDLFRRVLRDLWQAAALAPEPRRLEVVVESVGRWTEVRVVRHADPVDPAVLQALFEPFDLADDASDVTIGLYLARALVVQHGGTIGVRQDDQTGELWVRVPRDEDPGDRALDPAAT